MNVVQNKKEKNKKLGEGAYGVAYQVISTSTLKQKLNQDFGGIDNIVIKFQNFGRVVEDDDCKVTGIAIKNREYTVDSNVCERTSEVVIHTKLVNSLCEPHNSNPFSICFFKMITYEVCGKQIISLTPLLAGGTLDKIPDNTPQLQINFDLINIAFALCVLDKTRTAHNDLKPDNIFLDDITSYDKCTSKNIIYSDSRVLFPVFYLEYGNQRLYFKSEGLKYIPKIGDWGMACSYDKKIFNKEVIENNDPSDQYFPNFYSSSGDLLFLVTCFTYFNNNKVLYQHNKLIKYLFFILENCLVKNVTNIHDAVKNYPVEFDFTDDFEKVIEGIYSHNHDYKRIAYKIIRLIDKISGKGGLPQLFLNCLLSFSNNSVLEELGVYFNIPEGFTQQDCVCIGKVDGIEEIKYDIFDDPLIGAINNKNAGRVNEILNSGNNISLINTEDFHGKTALYYAIQNSDEQSVKILVDHGADVNKKLDKLDTSYLFEAAIGGNEDIVKLLIEKGVDVNYQRKYDGASPLSKAVEMEHGGCIRLLLKYGAKDNFVNKHGDNILAQAILIENNDDLINLLIEHGSDILNKNVMTYSALMGNNELIKKIIQHGGDVNTVDANGISALMHAVKNNQLDTVKLLLDNGADVNYKNSKGDRAIRFAKKNNNTQIINLLIQYGSEQATSQNSSPKRSPPRRRKSSTPRRSPVRRSPSPVRRSPVRRSPVRRSPSPIRRSPVRRSPIRRSPSPIRRSPIRRSPSPIRRSPSPVRRSPPRRSPPRRSPSPWRWRSPSPSLVRKSSTPRRSPVRKSSTPRRSPRKSSTPSPTPK